MRLRFLLSAALVAAFACPSFAANFEIGVAGTTGDTNNWPGNEGPEHAIDGVGQKYLNFGKFNTGFAVTPAGGASTATSIKFWTANDHNPRDPGSFELWGSNETLAEGATSYPLSLFAPISVGAFSLPDTHNDGGENPLLEANAVTLDFDNSTSYTSYLVVLPDLKDAAAANSMQIAEVQLFDAAGTGIFAPGDPIAGGQLVPEPAAGLMAAMASLGLLLVRRRRG